MSKEIAFQRKARKQMKQGLDALANVVKVTLGPGGRCVAYEKSWGAPGVTKDGVTVAKEIELSSKFQNMGCEMVREVASRTNDDTGDGTTTATVLAQAIFSEGLKLVEAGINPMELKQGIEEACDAACAAITRQSKKISGQGDIARIATVSANGDEAAGNLIADALEKVSKDGIVTIEEARGLETEVDVVEGMQWDRGYLSPYFITDQKKLVCDLESPYVLVHEKKISSLNELLPVLELINKKQAPLLVVAEDIDGDALAALTLNKLRGVLKVAAVKAPGFGDRRKEMLKDIATLTGATAFMEGLGRKLESVTLADLGSVKRALLDKERCTLVDGKGKKADIKGRIETIKREIEDTNSEYDKEKLNERLAKLAGGVAVIRVGAPSEAELKERKDRFDDALAATRAAISGGVVPGGGVTLVRAVKALRKLEGETDGVQAGIDLLGRALVAPLSQIAANAGAVAPTVVDKVLEGKGAYGYNAAARKFEDLIKAGILDPASVVRTSLINACSIAALMLTTEAIIVDKPKPEAPAAGAGAGGMGGGMPGMGGMGMGGMGGMGMGGMGGMPGMGGMGGMPGMGDDFDMG